MRTRNYRKAVTAALAGIVLSLVGVAIAAERRLGAGQNPAPTLNLAPSQPRAVGSSFAPVVKRTLPAVVNISSSRVVRTPGGDRAMGLDPFFRQFFGDGDSERFSVPRERREQSLGSGVVISPEGYILTNSHVVQGATDIRVMASDKKEYRARLIGADSKTDVALIKVEGAALPVMTIGDSSKVEVGDTVLAIGNPFGVGQTVTMGIVSAMSRGGLGIEDYEDFIQTDAAINPGNSGGALINDRGELIGINTAILSPNGGNLGVGFAVPVNLARHVMEQLLEHGQVTRSFIGVVPQELTPMLARHFGLEESRGALVSDVRPGTPAAEGGMKQGDVILGVNGKPVTDASQLRLMVSMLPPGQQATFSVLRDGKKVEVTLRPEALGGQAERSANRTLEQGPGLPGVRVENLDRETLRELRLPASTSGVVVAGVDPSSAAAQAGLRPGDVIEQVNRRSVKSVSELEQALSKSGGDSLLLINRRGTNLFLTV